MAIQNWLDRTIGVVAPHVQLRRTRARIATDLVLRHYEAAATGRRTQNWNRSAGDANTVNGNASLQRLREGARDLVRNNPYAESALSTICDHTVGWGIVAKPRPTNPAVLSLWRAWAETTACDADGRHDFYGLQKIVMSTVVESGECLVRRRFRRLEDGLPIPLQLQVLEPDLLDAGRTLLLPNGGRIVQGVEFDAIGTIVAYWLWPNHPGAVMQAFGTMLPVSRRIPASEILHIFRTKRPGQNRAVSWFAPVVLRMKEFDEYEDATLMKQKIAACLAVIMSDVDGTAAPMGTADDTVTPAIDSLEPGAIINAPPGRTFEVVSPPLIREYADYCHVTLRAIATGLGVSYEDLTGDYTNLPFSAARMSRLRHQARVDDWRWRTLIPQFCDRSWRWAMDAAAIAGLVPIDVRPQATWTPPPMPMVDPEKEGLAIMRNVRAGIETLEGALRERGFDPDEFFAEAKGVNQKLDANGLVYDSDPRKMTQAGQAQSVGGAPAPATGEAA